MAKYDWEAIHREYRTDTFSIRELSRRHGASEATIRKRAREHGWTKNLDERVRQRTHEKITGQDNGRQAPTPEPGSDDDVVEKVADESAALVRGHRSDLAHWRSIVNSFSALVAGQLEAGVITIEKNGEALEIDVPLDYVGKAIGSGTQALERLIKAERQAFNLDAEKSEEDEGKTLAELMNGLADDTA